MKTILTTFLALSISCNSYAISKDTETKLLAEGQQKSRSVYYTLKANKNIPLAATSKSETQCELMSEDGLDQVTCLVRNVDEEIGWTSGLEIQWTVINGESAMPYLHFKNLRLLEH